MKAHIGVHAETKLVHTLLATAANVADVKVLPELLHGNETAVWGDQAYQGQGAVLAKRAPRAEDRICRRWRSKLHAWPEQRERNRVHSKTRSRVEPVFGVLKLRFGFTDAPHAPLRPRGHRKGSSWPLVGSACSLPRTRRAGRQSCADG